MLHFSRFRKLAMISSDFYKFDDRNQISLNKNNKPKTKQELEDFRIKFNPRKLYGTELDPELRLNVFQLMRISLRRLTLTLDKNYRNYFKNYGRTFFQLLRTSEFLPVFLMKRWYRQNFLNKHTRKNVDTKYSFVYFPLHVEPEFTLSIGAPFHSNQYELIRIVARSLPVGYKLLIKEHPGMKNIPWRKISDYKKFLEFPNVILIHPSVDPDILLKNCSILITVNGTSSLEAAFFKKPSIIFSDTTFSDLPFIYRVKNIEELPRIIRNCLKKTHDFTYLGDYIDTLMKNSIQIKLNQLYLAINVEFYSNGIIKDTKIEEPKMKSFLERHRKEFEILADEHIKKIKSRKKSILPKN